MSFVISCCFPYSFIILVIPLFIVCRAHRHWWLFAGWSVGRTYNKTHWTTNLWMFQCGNLGHWRDNKENTFRCLEFILNVEFRKEWPHRILLFFTSPSLHSKWKSIKCYSSPITPSPYLIPFTPSPTPTPPSTPHFLLLALALLDV